mmetsp:Transcript_16592/g.43063  ORF Transcript_16592/g.43063 Transcript_16592/m.43063 type:complete len:214 (+) Transcript_16592:3631-4272(+)
MAKLPGSADKNGAMSLQTTGGASHSFSKGWVRRVRSSNSVLSRRAIVAGLVNPTDRASVLAFHKKCPGGVPGCRSFSQLAAAAQINSTARTADEWYLLIVPRHSMSMHIPRAATCPGTFSSASGANVYLSKFAELYSQRARYIALMRAKRYVTVAAFMPLSKHSDVDISALLSSSFISFTRVLSLDSCVAEASRRAMLQQAFTTCAASASVSP